MARFYWVFDGFMEPDHWQHHHDPEHGLMPPTIREELRALLEPTPHAPKDEHVQPKRNLAPQAPNFR